MKKQQKKAIAVGAGVAALAAAAAGVYMLTGKNAKNRTKVSKWVKDMQNDVIRELDKAGNSTKSAYNKAVDTVAKNYKSLKNINAPELAAVATELKGHWDIISAELNNASKTVKRAVPVAKKAAKKAAAKKAPAKKTVASKKTAARKKR